MKQGLKKFNADDEQLDRFMQNVDDAISPIASSAIIDGQLLTGIVLTTATSRIAHRLGRKPLGYIVVGANAGFNTYTASTDPKPELFLSLAATGTVTVSLWVF